MKKWKLNRWERARSAIFLLNREQIGAGLRKLERFLFYLLIFFLPTQFGYHFWPNWAFILGVRVDYLAPAIYLTDVLTVSVLVVWLSRRGVLPRSLFWVFVFALANTAFSISVWTSLFKWLKVLLFWLFAFYVSQNKGLLREKIFFKTLSLSLTLVSLVGIAQFLLGRTIGGPFYFLGERSFNANTPGVSLQNIFGRDFLRPYSTFSHPNSLAGFLVLTLLVFPNIGGAVPWLAALLAGSLSAFIGLAAALIFRKLGKLILVAAVVASLLLPFVKVAGGETVTERLELSRLAGRVIKESFWIGIGLNTFTFKNSFLQPVHNIFLLVLSETGIFGFLIFLGLLLKGVKKFPVAFIFILVTGFFDHYWLTLQQNMLLLALVYGYFF